MARYTRISQNQKETLLQFMEEHYDFAKGGIASGLGGQKLWTKVTNLLNTDDSGASKDVKGWKQTWKDLKKQVKAKAVKNGTTGEVLSEFESRLYHLCGGDWVGHTEVPERIDRDSYSNQTINGSQKRKRILESRIEEEDFINEETKSKSSRVHDLYLDPQETYRLQHDEPLDPTQINTDALRALAAAIQDSTTQQLQAAKENREAIIRLTDAIGCMTKVLQDSMAPQLESAKDNRDAIASLTDAIYNITTALSSSKKPTK